MDLQYCSNLIESDDGVRVTFTDAPRLLNKFGRNGDVDTAYETVWVSGGDETYVSTNAIDKISSSSAGDTDQTMTVQGHTVTAGVFTRVTQTVDLAGQTETALGTAMARVERAFVSSGSTLAGNVYIYEDDTVTAGVPDTAAKIHMQVRAGRNQSEKCALTVPDGEYLAISHMEAGQEGSSNAGTDFVIETKAAGAPWRVRMFVNTQQGGASKVNIDGDPELPFLIVGPNTDVRVRAQSSAVNAVAQATLFGAYGIVVDG